MMRGYEPWGWGVASGAKCLCENTRGQETAGTAEVTGRATEESQFDSRQIKVSVFSPKRPDRCGAHRVS